MYGPRTHGAGVWCGLGGFLALVGFAVWGFGLSFSRKTHDVNVWWGSGGLWALGGSTVKGLSLVWPEDPQCRRLVWFREFVGACGLCSEGAVPCMAQGPKV